MIESIEKRANKIAHVAQKMYTDKINKTTHWKRVLIGQFHYSGKKKQIGKN